MLGFWCIHPSPSISQGQHFAGFQEAGPLPGRQGCEGEQAATGRVIKSDQGKVTGSQEGNKDSCLELRSQRIGKREMCTQPEHPGQASRVDDGQRASYKKGTIEFRPETGKHSGEL